MKIIRIIICVLCAVFALAFWGIEGFVLMEGEWKLYENGIVVLIQQMIKIAACGVAVYAALMGVCRPKRSSLLIGVCFFVISVIVLPFLANQIGIIFAALSALYIFTDTGLWRWISGRKQCHSISTGI